ncbi:MAG: NTF2 fold immunity protein [Blastocatellia bacterium]
MAIRLGRLDVERLLPAEQAGCVVICMIALVSCKDRNVGSQSTQPSVSIVTTTPQAPPQAAPMMTPRPPNTTYKTPKGYVPDAATAIKIAEAVWTPIYGEETLKNEKPFTAHLVKGMWIVSLRWGGVLVKN